ncbi:MAG: hypothetical protein WEC79_03370 [Thermomicrobiales bacterium]
MKSTVSRGGAWRLAAALLILCLTLLAGILPVGAQRPNGAGIVIRFGDGSVIYAYVQFEEETLTSEDLLYRSGLAVTIAPYSGLGAGVCSINGEGCPSDNCFCQSYTTPAFFWHFYANDGGWRELLRGVSNRDVGDGDIDGWSWTAGESGLPEVTIDEIALMNGVDRNPPAPPTETPTPEPTSTSTLAPTNTPLPTATQPAPTPTTPGEPTATVTPPAPPTASPTPTSGVGQVGLTASPTRETSPTATSPRAATPSAPTPTLTLIASATTLAVLVQPDGTAVPLEVIQTEEGSSVTNLMLFGGLVAVAAGAGVFVWARGRRAA